ncbi:MAG: DNA polymerase III subunit delta [Acholeplasmatales bacterium]|jgi:DNA polymerase-3 subunit delta|nr:DNA polymerase III subunit delta [Acholeplasmatales bacterium]
MGKINCYTLVGSEKFLLKKELDKLLASLNENIVPFSYDLENTSLSELESELDSASLFDDEKIIIIESIDKIKEFTDVKYREFNYLKNYLNKPNPCITLIILYNYKGNISKDLTVFHSLITSFTKVIQIEPKESNTNFDFTSEITNRVTERNLTISKESINLLIEYLGSNLYMLFNELEKIITYCIEKKTITHEDVLLLIDKPLEEKAYELTGAFLKKDSKKALRVYHDFILAKIRPLNIVSLIYKAMNDIIYVKKAIYNNLPDEIIMEYLNIKKPGALYYRKQDASKIKNEWISSKMKELSKLDISLKSNSVNPELQVELFLLKK